MRIFISVIAAVWATTPVLAEGHSHKMHQKHQAQKMHRMATESIIVKHPWARKSVGRNGAVYLTITNQSGSDDKLTDVVSKIAKKVELHTHKMDGNILRMRPLDYVHLSPGGTVTLKPGGHHVMLMGLNKKLREGDRFPLILVFEKAGKQTVQVIVKSLGYMGGQKHPKAHHDHKKKH